jgi:hypothetical protein
VGGVGVGSSRGPSRSAATLAATCGIRGDTFLGYYLYTPTGRAVLVAIYTNMSIFQRLVHDKSSAIPQSSAPLLAPSPRTKTHLGQQIGEESPAPLLLLLCRVGVGGEGGGEGLVAPAAAVGRVGGGRGAAGRGGIAYMIIGQHFIFAF